MADEIPCEPRIYVKNGWGDQRVPVTTALVPYQADAGQVADRQVMAAGGTKLGFLGALLAEAVEGDGPVRLRIFTSRPLQLESRESDLPPGITNLRHMMHDVVHDLSFAPNTHLAKSWPTR